MLKNNDYPTNNPIVCEMSEKQLVAVLYGEADPAEEQEFARHLIDCQACQAEFVSFGEIKNTFSVWREEELANLTLSEISLPTDEKETLIIHSGTSWFANLSKVFLFPKIQWQTAAAITVIVVAVALLLAATLATLNRENIVDTARNNSSALEEQIVRESNLIEENNLETAQSSPSDSQPNQSNDRSITEKIETKTSRTPVSTRKPAVLRTGERRKFAIVQTKSVRSRNTGAEVALPTVEIEENSLRLSVLLDEVGSIK